MAGLMAAAGIRGAYRKPRLGAGRGAMAHPATDLVRPAVHDGLAEPRLGGRLHPLANRRSLLHVAAVMDLYSRMIVGWSMARHLRAKFLIDAIEMATSRRDPEPGLIHHSDQGLQDTSF